MTRYVFLIFFLIAVPVQAGGTVILFLGDSLTAGYGVEADESFVAVIKARLHREFGAVEVINGGVSGSTSAGALNRLQWYQQKQPDILFLALGANDGLRGLSTRELYENLYRAVSYAQKQGMQVILAGMEVPPNYGKPYADEFRSVYRRLAGKTGARLMPFLLEGVAGLPEYNLADGIHPNVAGHRLVADKVYPYIVQELDTRANSTRVTTAEKVL